MSEKMTRVHLLGVRPGYMVRGHVSYQEAITQATRYYVSQLEHATAALAALDSGRVEILHQTGIYRARNVRPVRPDTVSVPLACAAHLVIGCDAPECASEFGRYPADAALDALRVRLSGDIPERQS
jgi:hypothetical protein